MKHLISVAEVKAVLEDNQSTLYIDDATIVTPAAVDFARENGIILSKSVAPVEVSTASKGSSEPGHIDMDKVVNALKEIMLGGTDIKSFSRCKDSHSKFQIVHGKQNIEFEEFDTGVPGNRVQYKEILNAEESPNMAVGLLKIISSSFPWHLSYDEVDYVLEGSVTITINGEEHTAYAGDVIYVPDGSDVIWTANEYAKLLYVTYPANWADLL